MDNSSSKSSDNHGDAHQESAHARYNKIGVLLINQGTPEDTSTKSIRRYLRTFLSDRRVIEVNPLLWQVVLSCFILPFRPKKIAKEYESIWLKDSDESPLRYYTRRQAEKLSEEISGDNIVVEWAFAYTPPFIDDKIKALKESGCQYILALPLYPQYSATTTAAANDAVFNSLRNMRWQPAIHTINSYYDDDKYIEALANSVEAYFSEVDWQPDVIIASFHGIPKEYFKRGDPYYCHCHKTASLLRKALGRDEESLLLAFQSRMGPTEWLQPYTDKAIEKLAGDGVKSIAVITPGFSADCLETLVEIDVVNRKIFMDNGGENYALIPCLNDSDDGISAISSLVKRAISQWAEKL